MKRALAFAIGLAFVAGCSGAGGGGNGFVPGATSNGLSGAADSMRGATGDHHRRMAKVLMRMRIPRRHRRGEMRPIHPATISPLTQSVSIAVNGGAANVFNATPSSPNCALVAGITTCTFTVNAPIGTDTFAVSTFSATAGGGTILDHGTAAIAVVAGKANTALITIGPIVSTTADTGVGSLRFAIANASPNDTIMFMLTAGSIITVGSPITPPVNVTIAGPGVTAAAPHRGGRHSNVTLTGLTISGGGAQQIFVINTGITATISGLILSGGLATSANHPGGAIYNAGSLGLSNDGFTGNNSQVTSPFVRTSEKAERPRHNGPQPVTAFGRMPHCAVTKYYGGALYNHGTVVVSSSIFDSNILQNVNLACSPSGSYGGAIYNDADGTLVSSGNTYSNNSAYKGGAVYNNSSAGQASFTGDTFTGNSGCNATTGCAVSGCTSGSGNGCTTFPEGFGAAIYDAGGPGVTIASSTFSNNVVGGAANAAFGQGGALYLGTGAPTITGSVFSGNVAGGGSSNCSSGAGGAIYESASGPLEIDNDTFTSNTATGDASSYGGAIYNNSEADRGSGDTFQNNSAIAVQSGSGCNTGAQVAGGALYAGDGASISSSTFSGNTANSTYDAYAGAIYENNTTNLTGDTFTSNTAVATGAGGGPSYTEAYGGAIYNDSALSLRGSTFTSNSATAQSAVGEYAYGGAVYGASGLTTNANTFTSNSVSIPAGTGSEFIYGGAVYVDSSLASNGDTFTSNTAGGASNVNGGAVSFSGSYTMSSAKFTSNTATATAGSAYGGGVAIFTSGSLTNSTFTGNAANSTGASNGYDQGGGGIYDDSASTLSGLTVANNSTTGGSGGGIFTTDSTPDTINASTISGNVVNSAANYSGGGGIYAYYGSHVTNSTISGNGVSVAGNYAGGGGIYIYDTNTVFTGTTFTANSVTGAGTHSGGGAIFAYDSASFTNDTITANASGIDGGGLESYQNYNIRLTNVTMYQNRATGNGGNVFNDNNSSPYVDFSNSIIAGGSAATGPDVYNSGTVATSGYNLFGAGVDGGGSFSPNTGDQVGTDAAPINPLLQALSNNGGPTFTNAESQTSPTVSKIPVSGGSCNGTGVKTDQRGYLRGTSFCDMGAFEFGASASGGAGPRPSALTSLPGRHHPHEKMHPRPPHHNATTK